MAKKVEDIRDAPPSPLPVSVGVRIEDLRVGDMGDSIKVGSPNLASRITVNPSMNPSTSNTTTSEPACPASPASSTSSLSDPPSEPNSPILFAFSGLHIKHEPIGDISDISGKVAGLMPSFVSPNSGKSPSRAKGPYHKPRVRGVDVCADADTVAAYRVAKALADVEDKGLAITGSRPIRFSNRPSSKNITSTVRPSASITSLNGKPGYSKKRARSSTNNKPPPNPSLRAIKQEKFENIRFGTINSSLIASPPEQKKKLGRHLGKKQKVNPTSKLDLELSQVTPSRLQASGLDEEKQSSIVNGETTSATRNKGVRKKKFPLWSWAELKNDDSIGLKEDHAKLEQVQAKRRMSLPPGLPSFTYKCGFPFDFSKGSIHGSRAWSEGIKEPRDHAPVVPQFYRKDGILTDVVTITESRLRPRKSFGNLNLESPTLQKPKQPRRLLISKKVQRYNLAIPKKRALDDETEESSDGDITSGKWLSDDNSEKTDDQGNDDEEDDGDDNDSDDDGDELSGLEIDDIVATVTIKRENGQNPGKLTPLKKQKLNSGKGSNKNKTKKKAPQITDIKDLDDRIWPEAAVLVDGIYMIPKGCRRCLEIHCFCNRKMPCGKCSRKGVECSRAEGLLPAKPKQNRKKGPEKESNFAEFIAPEYLEFSPSPPPQKKPRGRPGKTLPPTSPLLGETSGPSAVVTPKIKRAWVKKEVKEVPMINLVDPQEGKPPGIGKPEVWCESRQELCESLPYYRSYQSGCYGHNGLVHGYLLDGFPAPRDYIDGKVVISHTGGKSAADDDGQRRLLTNQTPEDKIIKYLLANMKNQLPLVLIMGQHCCNSPSKLPHRYCVMDWFKVTAGWAERDPRSKFTRWKFRFEKLDVNVDGWWASRSTIESDPHEEMVTASCSTCRAESPHVYQEGWMCLKPECTKFWILGGKDAPADVRYTYNFLHCRTTWPSELLTAPNPLGPSLNPNRDVFFDGGDVSRVFWKGMCCPKCGRLNCREAWAGWRCLSCDFKLDPPRTIFDAARLADPHRPVFTGPAIPANTCHDDITFERFVKAGMTVIQYQLGDCGTVTHILANQSSNARPMDADWLFREYQSNEMPFKRFPLGNHKSTGRLLTQQFTFNCGAPYKFIVDVESLPFDKSPPVVSRALEVIHDRVSLVHPEAEFNEILNVGYFEKQKMDYHDDGEAGLGETVASISLGAPARMRFRLKARYINERHLWTTRPPTLPQPPSNGSIMRSEPQNDGLDPNDDEDDDFEHNEDVIGGQQSQTPPGRGPKKGSKARVKLDLCLSHGDVMVMKGRDIQKYWEHSVIPQGLFRIAATARLIMENHPGVKKNVEMVAKQPAKKPELVVPSFSVDTVPRVSSTASSSPMHFGSMVIDYPAHSVDCDSKSLVSHFKPDESPSDTEPGVKPIRTSPGSYGGVGDLNAFPSSVSQLQCSLTGVGPAQRFPNFPRADILHSMDQSISLGNSMPFTLPSCQVFSEKFRGILEAQSHEFHDVLDYQMPSSHPTGSSSENTYQSDQHEGRNHLADDSAEIYSHNQPGPSDSGRVTDDTNWTFEQTTQTTVPIESVTSGAEE